MRGRMEGNDGGGRSKARRTDLDHLADAFLLVMSGLLYSEIFCSVLFTHLLLGWFLEHGYRAITCLQTAFTITSASTHLKEGAPLTLRGWPEVAISPLRSELKGWARPEPTPSF